MLNNYQNIIKFSGINILLMRKMEGNHVNVIWVLEGNKTINPNVDLGGM